MSAIAAAAVLGVAAWLLWLWLGPWLTRPSADPKTIEQRFHAIAELGKQAKGPVNEAEKLKSAAKLIPERRPTTGKSDEMPFIDDKALAKHEIEAIGQLVAWSKAAGKFPTAGCRGDSGQPTPGVVSARSFYQLGRLALESSAASERIPSRVHAALRLGHEMQARGNLAEYAAGLKLSADAARWALSRKAKPDSQFRNLRPTAASLRSALARAAACGVESLRGAEGWGFDGDERFGAIAAPPPFGLVSYSRERLVVMDFHGSAFGETRASRTAAEVVIAYRRRERPRSAALQSTLPDDSMFEQLLKWHQQYAKVVPLTGAAEGRKAESRVRRRPTTRRARKRAKVPR